MENQFNGKPIEYGQYFKYSTEVNIVSQFNFTEKTWFFMEDEIQLLLPYQTRVAVWRIKSLKN